MRNVRECPEMSRNYVLSAESKLKKRDGQILPSARQGLPRRMGYKTYRTDSLNISPRAFWDEKCLEMSRNHRFSQFETFRDIMQWYIPTICARDVIDTSNRTRGFVRCIKTQRIIQNDAVVAEIRHFCLSARPVRLKLSARTNPPQVKLAIWTERCDKSDVSPRLLHRFA